MSIAYSSKIVVSRYEHLKGRLVCYNQKHLCMKYGGQYTFEAGTLLLSRLAPYCRLASSCWLAPTAFFRLAPYRFLYTSGWHPTAVTRRLRLQHQCQADSTKDPSKYDGEYNQKVMGWEANDNARNSIIWGIFTLMLYHLVFLVLFMILFLLFLF